MASFCMWLWLKLDLHTSNVMENVTKIPETTQNRKPVPVPPTM